MKMKLMYTWSIIAFLILAINVFGTFVTIGAQCVYSTDPEGYVVVNCSNLDLMEVPNDVLDDVETFDLRKNHIAKLTNDSFATYPNIKKLLLSYNQLRQIDTGALRSLGKLELLDLTQNAIEAVPYGLPKSLTQLLLNSNPLQDIQSLSTAVGLRVLQLKNCDLTTYPSLDIMPNLIELDVSRNSQIMDLTPVHLAATCRLARLNMTGAANVFLYQDPSAHCRCLRVVRWVHKYNVTVYGLDQCPGPKDHYIYGINENPLDEDCAQAPDKALTVFKECMAEWEYRNTPYWAIVWGLIIAVAVLVTLLVSLFHRQIRQKRLYWTQQLFAFLSSGPRNRLPQF